MNQINPTIARLDRAAARLGLSMREPGVNRREITLSGAEGRLLRYRPGGKGVVKVESVLPAIDGWKLDAVAYRTVEQMEELFVKIAQKGL